MKRLLSIILFAIFIILVVFLTINTYLGYTKVVFNSKNERIELKNNKSASFEFFLNLILNLKSDSVSGINPKTIGVFYTDKERADNKMISDRGTVNFSSTKDTSNPDNILIYIYVSNETISNPDFQKQILDYTINTINYYKRQPNYYIYKLLSKYLELPINVKNN